MKRFLLALLFLPAALQVAQAREGHYTHGLFARGIRGDSGRYVLFQVRDPHTGSEQTVCTTGAALLSAIEIEKGWTYLENARSRAAFFANRHWKQPFLFTKPNAISRARGHASENQVAVMRTRLSKFTNAQLRQQLRNATRRSADETEVQKLYAGREISVAYASREAVAHVLLERGILVASDERTGRLRLP